MKTFWYNKTLLTCISNIQEVEVKWNVLNVSKFVSWKVLSMAFFLTFLVRLTLWWTEINECQGPVWCQRFVIGGIVGCRHYNGALNDDKAEIMTTRPKFRDTVGCRCVKLQYITRNMHTVFALLCFVVVIHWLISPYPSGLLHWHWGNLTIAPVPAKQPWWIWINTSCEFIMNDCITTTKQSTTKPCAYFLGYTVRCRKCRQSQHHDITDFQWNPILY